MDNFKTLMEIQELKDLLQDEVSKLKLKQDSLNALHQEEMNNEHYTLEVAFAHNDGEIKMMNKIIPILNDIILNKY